MIKSNNDKIKFVTTMIVWDVWILLIFDNFDLTFYINNGCHGHECRNLKSSTLENNVSNGFKFSDTVTKSTNYLVCGRDW